MSNGRQWPGAAAEIARRSAHMDPGPRVLLVCEGEVTEPGYFGALRQQEKCRLVRIEVADGDPDPLNLVRECVRRRDRAERRATTEDDAFLVFEEVWAVFDRNEHGNFQEALELAQREEIGLAVSNPCFELWLLLHLEQMWDERVCRRVIDALQRHYPEYDKTLDFHELIQAGYNQAAQRAQALEERAHERGEPRGNPTSSVYRLTNRILRLGRDRLIEMRQTTPEE